MSVFDIRFFFLINLDISIGQSFRDFTKVIYLFDIIWIRFICIAGNFVIVNITMLRVLQLFVKNGYTFFRNTFYKLKSIIRLAYCYRNFIIILSILLLSIYYLYYYYLLLYSIFILYFGKIDSRNVSSL